MPVAADVLRIKGGIVHSVAPGISVLAATRLMNAHHIGALLVMDRGQLVGMFSERDVLTRVVAQGNDPITTTVEQVMTPDVYCCHAETDLDEIAEVMRQRRIRHVPVRDADERVVGLVSIGDVNAFHVAQQQATIEGFNRYINQRS